MTVRQKKGVRAAVLTLILLLLAIETFDSRHGYHAAQAESRETSSRVSADPLNVEVPLPAERPYEDQAARGVLDAAGAVEARKAVEKEVGVMAKEPVDVEKTVKVFEDIQGPAGLKKPDSTISGLPRNGRHLLPAVKIREPAQEKKTTPDLTPGREPAAEHDPGTETGDAAVGDKNRGHGNDEDGYDEDNPGRGCFDGVRSSGERGDRSGSGSSGGKGGRGGSKKKG